MTEISRDRDVNVLVKGSTFPVRVTPALAQSGWPGGIGVTWAPSANDDFLVTISDGASAGFLLEASTLDHNQWTGMDGAYVKYQFATLCAGTWVVAVKVFEKYTWASRQSGPLVPLSYSVGDRLRFSLNGKFSIENEWLLSSDPRGSNQLFVATVAQIPSIANKQTLLIQTSI
jgi:hypothetical protein